MRPTEANAAVIKKQGIRHRLKGWCLYCGKQGKHIHSGENAGMKGRVDRRNWKRKRLTKYKVGGT